MLDTRAEVRKKGHDENEDPTTGGDGANIDMM